MNDSIKSISSTACPIVGDNIDTDQIIPARYLTAISFENIEKGLFYDLRFDKQGNKLNFATDDVKYKNHEIYIVNSNFGCGSSREHAPQAIKRSGIKAIIGVSYSEIFIGNCVAIGLPCFSTDENTIKEIQNYIQNKPDTILNIDLQSLELKYDNKIYNLELSKTSQRLFLEGTYDPLNTLLKEKNKIISFEKTLHING